MFVSRIRALAAPDFGSALGAAVHGTKMCAGSRVKCRKRTPAWASNPAGAAACVREQAGTEEAGQQCRPGGRQHRERGCELSAAPAFAPLAFAPLSNGSHQLERTAWLWQRTPLIKSSSRACIASTYRHRRRKHSHMAAR
ncbi:hypothetical protein COCOBI_02-6740 [Coccomyxa sp. Obi]|nr:hypothetical protein COCOBI_02-6740 [Coccomyxa sp. Obi]